MKTDFEKSPTDFGFNKGYWTSSVIGQHIYNKTKIRYKKSRICQLMNEWGFSMKRPRMKSDRSDPEERAKFLNEFKLQYLDLLKIAKHQGLKLKILFTDEASIRRDGTIHYGWYKVGKIPEVFENGGRFESIKLIGAVDPLAGTFNLHKASSRITLKEYVSFLKHLSDFYSDSLIFLLHDNAPWHGKKSLPDLLESETIGNIRILRLPKYSPDMNPCEKLWHWMRETVSHCRYYKDLLSLLKSIWQFYRRAYNQKDVAKKRFKTEIPLFDFLK